MVLITESKRDTDDRRVEVEQARSEFKQKGLGYFGDIIKEEFRDNPTRAMFNFIIGVLTMFIIMSVVDYVNDDMRYCQVYDNHDEMMFDGKYRLGISYWNSEIERLRGIGYGSMFSDNEILTYPNQLYCNYNLVRWWDDTRARFG